jgi:hypothetical protein
MCVVFIGGGEEELELFRRLKTTGCFLAPVPFSTGSARQMFEEIQDRFSTEELLAIARARSAAEVFSAFLFDRIRT